MIGKKEKVVVIKYRGNVREASKMHITRLRGTNDEVSEEEEEEDEEGEMEEESGDSDID